MPTTRPRPKVVQLRPRAERSHRWLMTVVRQVARKAAEVEATSALVVLVGPRESLTLVAGEQYTLLIGHAAIVQAQLVDLARGARAELTDLD